MSDLSNLLGDVYASDPDGPPVVSEPSAAERVEGSAPDWADDARLDEAFADWTPGPSAGAHAMERELASPAPGGRLDDDLAEALSEALAAAPVAIPFALSDIPPAPSAPAAPLAPVAEPDLLPPSAAAGFAQLAETPAAWPVVSEPAAQASPVEEPAPMVVNHGPWQREHDDILPTGRSGRRRR